MSTQMPNTRRRHAVSGALASSAAWTLAPGRSLRSSAGGRPTKLGLNQRREFHEALLDAEVVQAVAGSQTSMAAPVLAVSALLRVRVVLSLSSLNKRLPLPSTSR